MKKTKTTNSGVFTTEPPIKSLYVAPEIRSLALENENMLCVISAINGGNEGLTEDEMGNDYDE